MKFTIKSFLLIISFMLATPNCFAQEIKSGASNAGWVSLGGRSTVSLFDHDGTGIGTGGQIRVQFSERVNTDWFGDYIAINVDDKVRSEYFHVGWSVLYYPFENQQYPKLIQPYILAGHCFDYNKKTAIADHNISQDRWGSAIQAGLGTHFNITDKFDISLTCQYMSHLTKEIEAHTEGDEIEFHENHSTLEGHLLATISLNYKLFRLWKK